MLEDADFRSPFYSEIFAGIRTAAKENGQIHTVIYGESLDLARFPGPDYEESLVGHLKTKYAHRPIGVIVSIGVASAKFLQVRNTTSGPPHPWFTASCPICPRRARCSCPARPHIFAKVSPAQILTAARAVVPDLTGVVLVGDAWKNPLTYGRWKQEFATTMPDLEIIDLSGMVLREVRERVGSLPPRSAILTSAMYSDGEGTHDLPAAALARVAERANRPIIITSDTFLGRTGVGGFPLLPETIGQEAGQLVRAFLGGELPSNIPPVAGDNVKPIFDWRQLKLWNVDEAHLPPEARCVSENRASGSSTTGVS